MLVAARAGQGLGAALIAPAAMALVLRLFTEPADLGKAMGIWGAAAPAGGTAGVFLGGVITEWIDWRWTFLINVPIGVLVLAAVPSLLPRVEGRGGKLDLAGAATCHRRALDGGVRDRDGERLRLGLRAHRRISRAAAGSLPRSL